MTSKLTAVGVRVLTFGNKRARIARQTEQMGEHIFCVSQGKTKTTHVPSITVASTMNTQNV